jgi:zinc and cadmium transporter
MSSDLIVLLYLAFIGSIAGLLGGVIFLLKDSWAKTLCRYAVPFASGVLLTIALIDLLPESALVIGVSAFTITLAAFLAAFFFEQYFAQLHHHQGHGHSQLKSTVPLVVLGDTIHNFIDGVAIAAAFMVEPVFGVVVAFASFLHETPHEIGDFGILLSAGWSKRKTFIVNLLSASTTFLGALFVYFFVADNPETVGVLLAIAAGLFLYLGASDFLPEVGKGKGKYRTSKLAVLLLGVVIMFLVIKLVPHGHDDTDTGADHTIEVSNNYQQNYL